MKRKDYLSIFNEYFSSSFSLTDEDRIITWDRMLVGLNIYKLPDWPDSIFWFDNQGNWYFELDRKENYLWCSDRMVWEHFEKEFCMSYDHVQIFIRDQLKDFFETFNNQERPTPQSGGTSRDMWIEDSYLTTIFFDVKAKIGTRVGSLEILKEINQIEGAFKEQYSIDNR